jgi:hypothetical protein
MVSVSGGVVLLGWQVLPISIIIYYAFVHGIFTSHSYLRKYPLKSLGMGPS